MGQSEILPSILLLPWGDYNSSPANFFIFCALIYRMSATVFPANQKVMW